jgi:hypothetical protein
MSSLWTPDGERPVNRGGPAPEPTPTAPPGGAERGPLEVGDIDPDDLSDDERAQLEEMAEHMSQVRAQLAGVPASTVVANHAMGLYELAAIHLSSQPPALAEAHLAIDAMGALVEGLEGRLGEGERVLTDALAQIRLAFVQLRAAPQEG